MRLRSLPTERGAPFWSLLLATLLLASACGDNPTAPVPSVSGTVLASVTNTPVAGAVVTIGASTVVTDANGRFKVTDLTPGPATLRCTATGFEALETAITVPSGSEDISVALTRLELVEFGDFTLYVPASVSTVRGVLLALGGPNTRGFASAKPFGAPVASVEAALQDLGEKFRALAADKGLAVLGTSRAAMANGGESDQVLQNALQEASTRSGRAELANAPLLLYGISGGGPEASGFAARNPARVAGVFLKVPARVETLTPGAMLDVPTFIVLAEHDAFINNGMIAATFRANLRHSALWALALEPGVPHHGLTPAQRDITTLWMRTILSLRLGATASAPLQRIGAGAGAWGGDIVSGEIDADLFSPHAAWLPSKEVAERWKAFAKHGAPPGFSLSVAPAALTVSGGSTKNFLVDATDDTGLSIDGPLAILTSDREEVAQVRRERVCPMGCYTTGRVSGTAPGTANITVNYGGLTATVAVTVVP